MGKKIKVALFLDNKTIASRDLQMLGEGNPGIGGSEYMQLLITQSLTQQCRDLEIVTYITEKQNFPIGMNNIIVKDLEEAILAMKHNRCNIFILSNAYYSLGTGTKVLELIDKYKMPTIIWAHIFMQNEQYAYISNSRYIRLFVCLGKQQMEMLRGLRLYKKATYINYILPPTQGLRQINDRKIVVYVGALYPYKGFHILAKYWKYIKANVKDAELWVVGSAKLYGDNISLGKYGIAEANYEKKFIKYLLNADGKIDSSVKFFGNLGGSEKENIVSHASVGIFNPCGSSETFGLSGVEFEAMGIPVVSINKNSSPDIIKDQVTGLLYKEEKDFPQYIIQLLNDRSYNHLMGEQGRIFVTEKFSKDKIISEWHDAIVSVALGDRYRLKHDKKIMINNQIWLHHINNFLKEHTGKTFSALESRIVTGK